MKKIVILAAFLLFAYSGSAFATGTALATGGLESSGNGVTVYGGTDTAAAASATASVLGRLSKGVSLGVQYTQTGYALVTMHKTGSKKFGTANDSTAIFSQDASAAMTTSDVPANPSYTSFNTGWTAM